MPFGDRTGPLGQGPRTGRGAGYCSGFAAPGYLNPTGGFGFFGRGRGGGRGWRNWFYATGLTGWQRAGLWPWGGSWFPGPTQEQQAAVLKNQAEQLESALESIRKRLEQLESKTKAE
jgi:hypothetical protein